jgi:hypothetical protein
LSPLDINIEKKKQFFSYACVKSFSMHYTVRLVLPASYFGLVLYLRRRIS